MGLISYLNPKRSIFTLNLVDNHRVIIYSFPQVLISKSPQKSNRGLAAQPYAVVKLAVKD
jgi:hypothetical protein